MIRHGNKHTTMIRHGIKHTTDIWMQDEDVSLCMDAVAGFLCTHAAVASLQMSFVKQLLLWLSHLDWRADAGILSYTLAFGCAKNGKPLYTKEIAKRSHPTFGYSHLWWDCYLLILYGFCMWSAGSRRCACLKVFVDNVVSNCPTRVNAIIFSTTCFPLCLCCPFRACKYSESLNSHVKYLKDRFLLIYCFFSTSDI